jgi:hypothetical protein
MQLVLRSAFIFLAAISTAFAEVHFCAVCQEYAEHYIRLDVYTEQGEILVCPKCYFLPKCTSCGTPVNDTGTRLPDRRYLCARDKAIALSTQYDCEGAFRETKRDVMAILAGSGSLPDKGIRIKMSNLNNLTSLILTGGKSETSPIGDGHSKGMIMGLTASRLVGNDDWEHSIYILDHLSPARFTAVAAHEYAHAWINENVRKGRALNAISIEGFCEWIAYKVMKSRNETIEREIILDNQYTKGQVYAFIRADNSYRSYDVIKWIKDGKDDWVDFDAPNRILTLDQGPSSSLLSLVSVKTPVPSTLTLRGISGTPKRRFALINDKTLQPNEKGTVRLADTNVVVQCLSISSNSVVIQVLGDDKPTVLYLSSNH